jgi:uncharacterized protein (TIGR00297 family)
MASTRIGSAELARKLVHVSMGFFALALVRLTWWQAALAAVAALAFNGFVLPLFGRKLFRPGELGRIWTSGIVVYPLVVLLLILFFRERMEVAAAGWGFLAAGDAAATLIGRGFGGPKLPWNDGKSWSGLVAYFFFGGLAAGWLVFWTRPGLYSGTATLALVFAGAAAGALVESLPGRLDDNLTAPLAGAAVMALLAPTLEAIPSWSEAFAPADLRRFGIALGVNLVVAAVALATRLLRPSGVLAGLLLGFAILAFGGWRSYAILWLFFALGTAATKWKYAEKAKLGAAQDEQGKRGARHAIANCGLGALLVVVAAGTAMRIDLEGYRLLLRVAFVAAFATALADTLGSELGSALGRTPRLITTWKRVPPGTDGAVSLPGTIGGIVGAALVAAAAWALHIVPLRLVGPIVAGGFIGTTVESFLGATLESRKLLDNEAQNFLNTVIGALAAVGLVRLVSP